MYVCVCNGLKEKDVVQALRSEGCSADNVHDNLGCRVSCGNCLEYIENCLEPVCDQSSAGFMSSRTLHESAKD